MKPESDFTQFIAQFEDQIWRDFDDLRNERELRAALNKWREPNHGILVRVQSDPYYALAETYEQEMFQDYFAERLRMKEQYFYERMNRNAN